MLPGLAFQLSDQRRVGAAISRRAASTASRSANVCRRSVRGRSSPGVCGAAQQQHRDQRGLLRLETELLLEPLVVLDHPEPRGLDEPDQLAVAEPVEGSTRVDSS